MSQKLRVGCSSLAPPPSCPLGPITQQRALDLGTQHSRGVPAQHTSHKTESPAFGLWLPGEAALTVYLESVLSVKEAANPFTNHLLSRSLMEKYLFKTIGQPSPWVGPGKPNLPLGLRGKAGGGARVTAGRL